MAGEISYNAYRRNNYDEKEYYSMIGGYSGGGSLGNYLLKTGDTATGSYTFDTDTLFIDADNHAIGLGIGSDSPGSLLDMEGALTVRGISAPGLSSAGQGILYFDVTSNVFKISENGGAYKNIFGGYWTPNGNDIYNNNSGGVGIGISSALGMLHLNGDAEFSCHDLVIQNDSNNCGLTIISGVSCYVFYEISSTIGAAIGMYDNGNLRFLRNYSGWSESITIQNTSGNVGINNSDPVFTLSVNGTGYFTGEVLLEDNIGSDTFFSGFGGSGWRLDADSSGVNTLSVDNLYVRKALNVYELIINQIRATNGSLWVSDSAKLDCDAVLQGSGYYRCYIDTDDGNVYQPFVIDDVVRCQRFTGRGVYESYYGSVYYWTGYVRDVDSGGTYFDVAVPAAGGGYSGKPKEGDVVVRVGNINDTDRQGSIYLTASDHNAPYLDVMDGVVAFGNFEDKIKVRLGNLTGITDADFGGALSGYGLYSNNIYLKGKIVISSGSTGFANLADAGTVPTMAASPTGTGLFLSATHMGYYTASAWKTYMDNAGNMVLGDYAGGNAGLYWDQSGAALNIRGIIRATSGDIGGWTINSAYLAKDTGTDATSAGMVPTDYPFYGGATYANRATAPFRVTNAGALTASDALITGTLQTGTSGKRAVLSGANNNMLFYGMDGSLITIDDSLLTDDPYWEEEPGIKIEGTSYFSYPSCLVSSMVFEMQSSNQFYVKTNETYLNVVLDMVPSDAQYTPTTGRFLGIDIANGRIFWVT
jgi:hypothetical protein